ncbi:MAG: Tfp pilus assembly protein FimT/FimU [bacterium]
MSDIHTKAPDATGRTTRAAGYSMIEILMVIGIIGILVSLGTAGYMTQMSSSRVESGIQILDASLRQARQSAIAMRRARRVVIDAGRLEGFVDNKMNGIRVARAAVWVEGKVCEEYPFDTGCWCSDPTGKTSNAYPVGDTAYFPDGIMVADVDGRIPGLDGNSQVFCIEFNARGSIAKVYFQGEEAATTYNAIAPVIHLARDSEVFSVAGQTGDYKFASGKAGSKSLQWGAEDANERYKVQTIEVVRLTGRTRSYNYAILNPWPLDEWKQP